MSEETDINNASFFEGCCKDGPIKCIFLAEFHPIAGPKITCQVPDDYISKDTFEAVSVYIIPKAQLQRSTLTITAFDLKILGYPVKIDNKKYARNAFYFNLCFVFDAWARTVQYETLVKKFSEYLTSMEIETAFLSEQEQNINDRLRLVKMLKQVLRDLNMDRMCSISEGTMTTHLKVQKINKDPQPTLDHHVPVFLESLDMFQSEQWDLTTQQVLPFINGINHVAKIAAEAVVENNLVKACLQNLVYYGVVKMVPIFQYSNVYTATSKLHRLTTNKSLQDECLLSVAKSVIMVLLGWFLYSNSNVYTATSKLHCLTTNKSLQDECLLFVAKSARQLPNIRDIFRLYSNMTHGTTIKDLCARFNPIAMKVDERRLVQFGVLQGLIRRVHKYPVSLVEGGSSVAQQYYNGLYSLDEICCATGLSTQQIEDQVEKDPNIIMIWK